MKAVILAGGFGTRLSEETQLRPKPMVEIGGKPILWHIMKIYSSYDINDFVVCCGYKGYMIKEYFANYFLHMSDVTFDMSTNRMEVHHRQVEPWRVTLINTGELSNTAGRLKRVRDYVGDDTFCFTYGDGLSDVNISQLLGHHRNSGRLATVTGVQPPGRFGALNTADDQVLGFQEKPAGDGAWVNGGFFVLEPAAIEYIEGDRSSWETDTLPLIAKDGQLSAYYHRGFWRPMDSLRDKTVLEEMWRSNLAPWKVW